MSGMTGPVLPESRGAIAAQLQALVDPRSAKNAVFIPRGSPPPLAVPPGLHHVQRPEGHFITSDPMKAAAFRVAHRLDPRLMARLLDHPEPATSAVASGAPLVVQGTDPQGGVVHEGLTSPQGLPDALAQAQSEVPDGEVGVMTPEESLAQRFDDHHADTNAPPPGMALPGGPVGHPPPQSPGGKPQSMMMMGSLQLGPDRTLDRMLRSMREQIGPELADYAAGLQPFVTPAGVQWQEETIHDTITRDDASIEAQMVYYFERARSYDWQLSYQRMTASDYYNGALQGDEEDGRSKLVMTTVRDTVRATLPSLLRVFTAVENPIEFAPEVAEDEQLGLLHAALARQATSYVHWALFSANRGWQVLHDAMLDGLVRKVGWVRWYWGEQRDVRIEECDRLLAPQLSALLSEPGITAQRVTKRPMLPNEIRAVQQTIDGGQYLQAGGEPVFYRALITRHAARSWPIIEAVPAECVWVVSDADTVENAKAIFHIRDVPASELIAAGLPEKEVLQAAQESINLRRRMEMIRRDPASGRALPLAAPPNDPSMKLVRYCEGWCRMDTDGDNIAELIHTHAVGESPRLVRWDRTDDVPLAAFSPYREAGRVIGLSQADMVMDLQRTETRVTRAVLDSLGQSIFPRTVMQIGAVIPEDVRQTAIGAIIRVTQPGAVQELTKPFIGDSALNVMQYLEAVRESRTGITRASQGLTAESLQSTTPTAVSAQMTASQDRIDMIARTMAETGLAHLYRGILRLMAKHQDRPNVISVRGQWVSIDPRALSVQWAVQCNVGGRGTVQEQLAVLNAIAQKQEMILTPAIQSGRLDTPIVGLPEYRNTLARMCEVAGISDVVSYFKALPVGWQPPPPPPPQPSTDQVLAQVEQMKTQAQIADDTRQAQTDRFKLALDDERERDEAALTAWTQTFATAAQHNMQPPSITDFKQAMASDLPVGQLLAPPPPPMPIPGGSAPPGALAGGLPPGGPPAGGGPPPGPLGAVGPRNPLPMPGGGPPVPRGPMPPTPGGAPRPPMPPMPGGPPRPPLITQSPMQAPTQGPTVPDPATLVAMRRALLSRGSPPSAGQMLAMRAAMPSLSAGSR